MREKEAALADPSSAPQSEADFEREVVADPNSSVAWIQFMARPAALPVYCCARAPPHAVARERAVSLAGVAAHGGANDHRAKQAYHISVGETAKARATVEKGLARPALLRSWDVFKLPPNSR